MTWVGFTEGQGTWYYNSQVIRSHGALSPSHDFDSVHLHLSIDDIGAAY